MVNTPYGGKLIQRILSKEQINQVLSENLFRVKISNDLVTEVKNICNGVYSPLEGFMTQNEVNSVVENMRLPSGLIWSIPIILDVDKFTGSRIEVGQRILLVDVMDHAVAVMSVEDKFHYDKRKLCKSVFETDDLNHPGCQLIMETGDIVLGGKVDLIDNSVKSFPELYFSPKQTREAFERNGWKKIAAFQTRNPPHRAHEYLQKCALEITDGLFINPVIGKKKEGDFKDELIIRAYQKVLEFYYPPNRVFLGILPYEMKYAGPKEAILHAIMRRNFGCTHFIIGRDHAGVGNYYGTFEAQQFLDKYSGELGIIPLDFDNSFFCTKCQNMATAKTCSHSDEFRIAPSGTKVRAIVKDKVRPPETFMRPEVADVIMNWQDPYVKKESHKKGFCLWFTGLSGSGKSTIANALIPKLEELGVDIQNIDGDLVRRDLTNDLGFSKHDRDENIKRVSFVAEMLDVHGVAVLMSFISPYREERNRARDRIDNFIEVYVKCPLGICEQRDVKGLYKKARDGKIKGFTGIDDPYEEPENPEIVIESDKETVEQSVQKILDYLRQNKFI
jgi:sulfate adenylyltransferase